MANNKANTLSGPKNAFLLAAYPFFLLAGYYQIKPLTRTLFLEEAGTTNIPYLWIGSAALLLFAIPLLQWYLKKSNLLSVLEKSKITFGILLALVWLFYSKANLVYAVLFYVLVDAFIVILVENFWSAANTAFENKESKKWYGLIGSGATLGAIAGSAIASFLLDLSFLRPIDLILVALAFLSCAFILGRLVFAKSNLTQREASMPDKLQALQLAKQAFSKPLIRLVVVILILMQLVGPLIEFIFLTEVETNIENLRERTKYLSQIFALISSFALAINLIALPFLLKYLGLIPTLLVQPLLILGSALWGFMDTTLNSASSLKICDRGLSYSVGRSAREILYIEQNAQLIYFVKTWIDMFGYRLFKVIGASLVLVTSSLLNLKLLFSCVIILSSIWIIFLFLTLQKSKRT